MPHTPAVHVALRLGATAQVLPHMPQFRGSVSTETSQPSPPMPRFMLQSRNPEEHGAKPQVPPRQRAPALGSFGQARPHVPQLVTLVLMFVSQSGAGSPPQSA